MSVTVCDALSAYRTMLGRNTTPPRSVVPTSHASSIQKTIYIAIQLFTLACYFRSNHEFVHELCDC